MQPGSATLDDLIPPGIFTGVGLVLPCSGRFLFGLHAPQPAGEVRIVRITGIGGRMEPADASYLTAARREAREEIDCDVSILDCPQTLLVRAPGWAERVTLAGEPRPCALVFRRFGTLPRQPWDPSGKGEYGVIIYLARLNQQPRPAAELPGLVWLNANQLAAIARRDVPLAELVHDDAPVLAKPGMFQPGDLARLVDSPEALVLALGEDGTRSFFHYLAALTDPSWSLESSG